MPPRCRHLAPLARRLLLAAALACLALAPPARAADVPHSFSVPTFDIPITWGVGGQYKQATLYVSTNGQRFQHVHTVPAGRDSFSFTAPADGLYFFVLQLEDQEGRKWPDPITADDVSLKVFVDRKAPKITLRPTVPQDGTVAVVWKIEDERAVDLSSIRLECSPKGRQEWTAVPIKQMEYAQRSWSPAGNGPFDVRLTAKDRAGNVATATTQVSPTTSRTGFTTPPGLGPRREHHVPSKKFHLKYQVDKVGPSDIKQVEVWWTEDTKTWQLLKGDAKREGPMPIEVRAEGLYGFTIRPVNGVGRGPEAPRPYQEPQIWVRVDETKPRVALRGVSDGQEKDTLIITWSATDDHLRDKPITIYSSTDGRDWKVLKAGLENSGTYTCPIKELPYQFHVRVEATDKAGNKGTAETRESVKIDPLIPEVKGIGVSVEAAGGEPDGGVGVAPAGGPTGAPVGVPTGGASPTSGAAPPPPLPGG